jgi:hypothetical protein
MYFPESTVNIPLPANILSGEERFYNMNVEGVIRECSIKEFQRVWANWELVLWKNGEMLTEGFAYPWLKEKLYGPLKPKAKFKIKNALRKPKTIKEPVLWCLDGFSTGGYYHWITEILPRLWMAEAHIARSQFAIPDYFFTRWPFCKEFFELLGVHNFLVLDARTKYLLEQLILPTRAGNPFYQQPVPMKHSIEWLREAALQKSTRRLGERLYVSRAKARYRKVLNEEELLPVLKKYGFQIIYFEDYSLSDQISICQHTKVLMGLHGAGLTNMVFLPPEGKLIEIRPDNEYHMYNCFFTLTAHAVCEYNYILCKYAPDPLPEDNRLDDRSVLVSPDEVDNRLSSIL